MHRMFQEAMSEEQNRLAAIKARAATIEPSEPPPKPQQTATKPRMPKAIAEQMGQVLQASANMEARQQAQRDRAERDKAFHRVPGQTVVGENQEPERVALGEHTEEVKERLAKSAAKKSSVIYTHGPLDNPEIREAIEKRCEKLDLSELMMTGRLVQEVSISSSIKVTFNSLLSREVWWLEEQASTRHPLNGHVRALWAGYAKLVLGVVSVGGRMLPRVVTDEGKFSDSGFDLRWNALLGFPNPVVQMIALNHGWFLDRVQQLFIDDFEQLKNG